MASRDRSGGGRRAVWAADGTQGTSAISGVGGSKQRQREGKTASANTDAGGNPEAGKKKKVKASAWSTFKRISVRKEHVWEIQKTLDGEKCSLRKTYNGQTEANDNVWARGEQHGSSVSKEALPFRELCLHSGGMSSLVGSSERVFCGSVVLVLCFWQNV